MNSTVTILGLESSCDDTAAAVVRHRSGQPPEILSSIVFGQSDLHKNFGGIVPEIAARAHVVKLDIAVEQSLLKADCGLTELDGIAVTAGPGLIGGVISGLMCAKGLAAGANLPLIGVNHLAGHALTPRLTDNVGFPYLVLLVSGGHCQFLVVESVDQFERLGSTIDDAPGEAFDKVARMLGLAQPGGPSVEREAENGNPERFRFPRPLLNRAGCDLSFSGLKTAILRERDLLVRQNGGLTQQDRADICAGFQAAVVDVIIAKSLAALSICISRMPGISTFAVAGGVASNMAIRSAFETKLNNLGIRFVVPPINLCTDNAAMIAWAGLERFRNGLISDLTLSARPRWPLDSSSPAILGFGKKGAKA